MKRKNMAKLCALSLVGVFSVGGFSTLPVQAETYKDVSLTASVDTDEAPMYLDASSFPGANIKGDEHSLVYDFTNQPNTIISSSDHSPILITKDKRSVPNVTIKGKEFILHGDGVNGIKIGDDKNVVIEGNLHVTSMGKNPWSGGGIILGKEGSGEGGKSSLVIHGNVIMKNGNSYGVYTRADDIFGGYSTESNYHGTRWAPQGISLGEGKGSTITIDGKVDLNINGTAVVTDPFYKSEGIDDKDLSIINISGGNIITPHSSDIGYLALASYGGTINVNMNENHTASAGNKVNIVGHILAMKNKIIKEGKLSGDPYFYRDGRINLGLDMPHSKWIGMVDNTGADEAGEVNIFLSKGATWEYTAPSKLNALDPLHMPPSGGAGSFGHYDAYDGITHLSSLHGGDSAENSGKVLMEHANPLHIENYSGYTRFFYAHNTDGKSTADYPGGNVVVNEASPDSTISLITDSKNINTEKADEVITTLNALAGKLTYVNHNDNHLHGLAEIASDLTGSSASLQTKDITFTDEGLGTVVAPKPAEETAGATYDQQIVMDNYKGKGNRDYWSNQGVLGRDNNYTFNKDTTIKMTYVSGQSAELNGQSAVIMWAGDYNNRINMNGHSLTLDGTSESLNGTIQGIRIASGDLDIDNVAGLNINLKDSHRANGINADAATSMGQWNNGTGIVHLNIHNDNKPEHAVRIRLDVPKNDAFSPINSGITVHKNTGISEGTVNIDGLVDIDLYRGHGLSASATNKGIKGSNYDPETDGKFDGARLSIGGGTIKVQKGYAVESLYNGVVKINATMEGDSIAAAHSDNPVKIEGNVLAATLGTLGIALATPDSNLHGMMLNDKIYPSTSRLFLGHGAQWINENTSGDTVINSDGVNNGSYVDLLKSEDGYLIQKNDKQIQINKLDGQLNVGYAHSGDGATDASYSTLGDLRIAHGTEGSSITMITDSNGLDLSSDEAKAKVFNSLAHKLYFEGIKDAEYGVTGNVKVASSLTASDATATGAIQFDDATGQGFYSATARPAQAVTDFTNTITSNRNKDGVYVDNGVLYKDHVYTFRKDSTVKLTDGSFAVNSEADININANKRNLTLSSTYTGTDAKDVTAVAQSAGHNFKLAAGNASIVASTTKGAATGVSITGGSSEATQAELSGPIAISASGTTGATGFVADGKVTVTDSDALTIGTKESPIQAGTTAATALKATNGAKISFTGETTAVAKGTALSTAAADTAVELTGKTTLSAVPVEGQAAYAVRLADGSVKINSSGENQDKTDVALTGNIAIDQGATKGHVQVGLMTVNSQWTGLADDRHEAAEGTGIDLSLANGAMWTNEAVGTVPDGFTGSKIAKLQGAADMEHAGTIVMKDSKALAISSYAGNVKVAFAHTGDGKASSNYGAGDVHIAEAAENSGIYVFTDKNNISMTDSDLDDVFESMAKKIWYDGAKSGKNNIYTKIGIASDLTSSAVEAKANVFYFDSSTGQGVYKTESGPLEGKVILPDESEDFESQLEEAKEYYKKHGVYTNSDNYEFHEDITIDANDSSPTYMEGQIVPVGVQGGSHYVDMDGHNLTINSISSEEEGENKMIGVSAMNGTLTLQNADTVAIHTQYVVEDGEGAAIGMFVGPKGHIIADKVKNISIVNEGISNNPGIWVWGDDTHPSYTNPGLTTVDVKNAGPAISLKDSAKDEGSKVTLGAANLKTAGHTAIDDGSFNAFTLNKDGNHPVTITGDIRVGNGAKLDVTLGTAESKWTGEIDDITTADSNLTLKNGATWDNSVITPTAELSEDDAEYYTAISAQRVANLNGGDSESNAGAIIRKSTNPLTLDKVSGFTKLIYAHSGDGTDPSMYEAGDTTVNTATADSHIIMMTDSTGVATTSPEAVDKVLNSLAGKLVYSGYVNGARDLSAKAMIASGLTASSASVQVKDMTFDKNTGRGKIGNPQAEEAPSSPVITGVPSQDHTYQQDGTIKSDGKYVVDKDLSIVVTDVNSPVKIEAPLTLDAGNHDITLDVRKNDAAKITAGIFDETEGQSSIKAKDVHIVSRNADDNGRAEGIHITGKAADNKVSLDVYGNSDINVYGSGDALGVYASGNSELHFHNDVSMTGTADMPYGVTAGSATRQGGDSRMFSQGGLYAGSDFTIQRGPKITVDGKTNIAVDGGAAVMANAGGSHIVLNGDVRLKTPSMDDPSSTPRRQVAYSAIAMSGTVDINVNPEHTASTGHNVELRGNIGIMNGAVNPNETVHTTEVNLGLDTSSSVLDGIVYNNFTDAQRQNGEKDNFNLFLSNGATWINEKYGVPIRVFSGSKVHNLVGAATEDGAGFIRQKDTKPITVDNFSGTVKVVYEKALRQARSVNAASNIFSGGNFVIKSASPNSKIILIGDHSNIDETNHDAVYNALENLAQKAQYLGYAAAPDNLVGKVGLSSDLTASAASISYKDIEFKTDPTNLGHLKAEDTKPGAETNPTTPVEPGKVVPSEPGKVEPSEPGKVVPSEPGKVVPSEPGKVVPSEPGKVVPSEPGKVVPSEPGKVVPSEPGKVVPPAPSTGGQPTYTVGSYETPFMQGIRRGLVHTDAAWRSMASDIYNRIDALRLEKQNGLWAEVIHGNDGYTDGDSNDVHHTAVLVGYNHYQDKGWSAGLSARHDTGSANYLYGSESPKSTSFAAYGLYQGESGNYVTVAAAVGQLKNSLSSWNEVWDGTHGLHGTGDYKATGSLVGLGLGKNIELGQGRFVNPYASVTYGNVGSYDFTMKSNHGDMLVSVAPYHSTVVRAGLRMGRQTGDLSYYGKVELAHDFSGKVESTYTPVAVATQQAKQTSFDTKDTWTVIGLGFEKRMGKNAFIKLAAEKALGAHMGDQNQVNASVTYHF